VRAAGREDQEFKATEGVAVNRTRSAQATGLWLAVGVVLLAVSCGRKVVAGQGTDLLDQVLQAGKLRVAVDPNYPPQSFFNERGELRGFDVDAGKRVGERLGVEVEFVTPPWDLIVAGNWQARWDLSIGSMAPTVDREKVLWFTEPYYYSPAAFAVHKDNTTLSIPADLAGKRVGVCAGSTYESYLEGKLVLRGGGRIAYDPPKGVVVRPYESDGDAYQDLVHGDGVRLDAVLMAKPMLEQIVREGKPLEVRFDPPFYEALAFALDKARGPSDMMLAKLNEIIAAMRDDGTLKTLTEKWYKGKYDIPPPPGGLLWLRTGAPLLGAWMVLTGLAGVFCLRALRKHRPWSQRPLTLGLFLLTPLIAGGLPVAESLFAAYTWGERLQFGLPLLALGAWHGWVVYALTRPAALAVVGEAATRPLPERLMAARRAARERFFLFTAAVWVAILVVLYGVLRAFRLDVRFMGSVFLYIMAGAGITLFVSAASVVLAVLLALLGALGRLSRNPVWYGIAGFYVSLVRGTPLLLQVFIWYSALPQLGIVLSAIVAGVLALGVNYGGYMTEIFRAGVQAVGKGQVEAAHALGMTEAQTLRRIVLPQAFRIVIPAVGNEFVAMLKDSSLVGFMGVLDLMFRALKVGRAHFKNLETLLIAGAFYWILTVVFERLQGRLEARMARGERK
jgi:His/Glu/Gln/Arg/opine family amino acid ABC transporter permease subunit